MWKTKHNQLENSIFFAWNTTENETHVFFLLKISVKILNNLTQLRARESFTFILRLKVRKAITQNTSLGLITCNSSSSLVHMTMSYSSTLSTKIIMNKLSLKKKETKKEEMLWKGSEIKHAKQYCFLMRVITTLAICSVL